MAGILLRRELVLQRHPQGCTTASDVDILRSWWMKLGCANASHVFTCK
jgi:hypothetical protein